MKDSNTNGNFQIKSVSLNGGCKTIVKIFVSAMLIGLSMVFLLRIFPTDIFSKNSVKKALSDYAGEKEARVVTDSKGAVLVDKSRNYSENAVSIYNLVGDFSFRTSQNTVVSKYFDEIVGIKGYNIFKGFSSMNEKAEDIALTLSADVQNEIYSFFEKTGKDGTLFAYNYKTGEVAACVSAPSFNPFTDGDETYSDLRPALINKALDYNYPPGSTMKTVTTIIALETLKNFDEDYTFTCTGSYTLDKGGVVKCHNLNGHGELTLYEAFGVSCNVYYAHLIEKLDQKKTVKYLKELLFTANGEQSKTAKNISVSKLDICASSAELSGQWDLKSVWSLIGQGDTMINMARMAMIAGAVAGGGETAVPYIVSGENEKTDTLKLMSPKTAEKMREIMGNTPPQYGIAAAKTGTAQINNGAHVNSLLLGYDEKTGIAYCAMVEHIEQSSIGAVNLVKHFFSVLEAH